MDPQNPFTFTPHQQNENDQEESPEVLAERRIADAGQSQAMYNYSQKLLEQKEKELMESIAMNYGRIREVERELGNLQLQLKLTSGPKKHALELLRKKIETQNEKVAYVRTKHTAAKTAYERLDAELKHEEAIKEQLCGELNTLVQEAARAQLSKLEELKSTLEGLYSGIIPKHGAAQQQQPQPEGQQQPGAPSSSASSQQQHQHEKAESTAGPSGSAADTVNQPVHQQQQGQEARLEEAERQEQERRRQEAEAAERRKREAEAAAARSRHVSLNPAGVGTPTSNTRTGAVAVAAPGASTGRHAPGSTAGPVHAPARVSGAGATAPKTKAHAANGSTGSTSAAPGARFAGFDT